MQRTIMREGIITTMRYTQSDSTPQGKGTAMARATGTELQTTDDATVDVDAPSFAELIADADETASLAVADKAELIGVPFVITRIDFHASDKGARDFVSCEIVLQDNTRMVLNDGSTGIRRDVVKYLTGKRFITPGEGDNEGKQTRFDNNVDRWDIHEGEIRFDERARAHYAGPEGLRLFCKRGLRKSDYSNEHGEGTTYYLA